MRILIISSLYGNSGGGAGILVSRLAHGLLGAGNYVSIITIGKSSKYEAIFEEGIKMYRVSPWNIYPFTEKDDHPIWAKVIWQLFDIFNLDSANTIHRLIKKESPDIIHIHKMRGFSSAVWVVAALACGGRIIQTCHDYESISPDGILRGLIGRMALKKQWPIRGFQLIRAMLSMGVSAVTAPNRRTLNRITETGIFPRAEPHVISNTHGFTIEELKAIHKRVGSKSNIVTFLFLGRLEQEKGIIQLCDAFLQVFKRNSSTQLVIAGSGTLDAELQTKYSEYRCIRLLGSIYGAHKENVLADCSVVVLPSTVDEVFPLTVVEAFAFGKPVIASNIGGLPDLVQHEQTGWLVTAGAVKELAEQMLAVVGLDKDSWNRMNRNCRVLSLQFTIEEILAEYLALYHQLVGRK